MRVAALYLRIGTEERPQTMLVQVAKSTALLVFAGFFMGFGPGGFGGGGGGGEAGNRRIELQLRANF